MKSQKPRHGVSFGVGIRARVTLVISSPGIAHRLADRFGVRIFCCEYVYILIRAHVSHMRLVGDILCANVRMLVKTGIVYTDYCF